VSRQNSSNCKVPIRATITELMHVSVLDVFNEHDGVIQTNEEAS